MKILLVSKSLDYISTGTGKMHARDARWRDYTMCGRLIPTGQEPQVTRQLADKQLCGRCLASLKTYTSEYVRIESEAAS